MTDTFTDLAALPTAAPEPKIQRRIERHTQSWRKHQLRDRLAEAEKADASVISPSRLFRYELNQMRDLATALEHITPGGDTTVSQLRRAMGGVERAAFPKGNFMDGTFEICSRSKDHTRNWVVSLHDGRTLERVHARTTHMLAALTRLDGILARMADDVMGDAKSRVLVANMRRNSETLQQIVSHSQYSVDKFARIDGKSR